MFDFIFNPGADKLISSSNRYELTLKNRMEKYGIKYKTVLSLLDEAIACRNNDFKNSFNLFKRAFDLSLKCSGYEFERSVRNMYDYEAHQKALSAVNDFNNSVLSKEQAMIFIEVFAILSPVMEEHFEYETRIESRRKAVIEAAGLKYERYVPWDHSESDRLFADLTMPSETGDSLLEKATNILKHRGINSLSVDKSVIDVKKIRTRMT